LKKWLRIITIITTGLVVAGLTFLINSAYIAKHTRLAKVAVATDNIYPYNRVVKYEITEVVESSVPQDAVTDLNFLGDREWFAGGLGIGKGDVIRKSRLRDVKTNPFGQALGLQEDKVLVGVKTDQIQSAGANIKPGVLVNGFVFIAGDGRKRADDAVIGPDQDPLLANLLVREVQNSDISTPGGKGREAIPAVAVIETSPGAAQRLVLYQETGKIYLTPAGVNGVTVPGMKSPGSGPTSGTSDTALLSQAAPSSPAAINPRTR